MSPFDMPGKAAAPTPAMLTTAEALPRRVTANAPAPAIAIVADACPRIVGENAPTPEAARAALAFEDSTRDDAPVPAAASTPNERIMPARLFSVAIGRVAIGK